MPRLTRTTALLAALSLGWMAAPPALADGSVPTATFALGRGGAAARLAVDVQHLLRELAPTTGTLQPLDVSAALDPAEPPERRAAIEEGKGLLEEGKAAYEQLDLEAAQAKFEAALKKFEFGYGYLDKPSLLVETLMYLGASWVLVGEPEKATAVFLQAYDIPGKKTMDTELFPPNIQEIFVAARQAYESAARGKVSLVSEPQGAELYLDSSYRGGSPLQIEELRVGDHLVRAIKDGYRPWGGRVKVEPSKVKRFKITLKPTGNRQEFSKDFAGLAAELLKGDPGPASLAMGKLLGAERMALVVLEGEEASMTLRGFVTNVGEPLRLTRAQIVLDATAGDYEAKLKEFLLRLLSSTPGQEEIDAGAADAAKLVAKVEGDGGAGEGLDLGDDGGKESGTAKPDDGKTGQGDADAVKAEEQREKAAQAKRVAEETARKKDQGDEDEAAFTWAYLSDKWWFWTAIGVVVVGAGVGLGVGLTAGGEESGGQLVLGLH
jgi:hypothetical protein